MVKKNNQKKCKQCQISNKMSLDHGKPFRLTSQQLFQTEIPSIHMGSKHTHATHSDSKTNIDYIYLCISNVDYQFDVYADILYGGSWFGTLYAARTVFLEYMMIKQYKLLHFGIMCICDLKGSNRYYDERWWHFRCVFPFCILSTFSLSLSLVLFLSICLSVLVCVYVRVLEYEGLLWFQWLIIQTKYWIII